MTRRRTELRRWLRGRIEASRELAWATKRRKGFGAMNHYYLGMQHAFDAALEHVSRLRADSPETPERR